MKYPTDLTNRVFGRLTVVQRAGYSSGPHPRTLWRCRCVCGTETTVRSHNLLSGTVISCGCARRDAARELFTTHGKVNTPEYETWLAIKQRCTNPNNPSYPDYGGRGITLWKAAEDSFDVFLAEAGPQPSPHHTIDRINNERGYEPGNIRWSTPLEQANNTRRCRFLTFQGMTLSLHAWGRRLGLYAGTICRRLQNGATVEQALRPSREGKHAI